MSENSLKVALILSLAFNVAVVGAVVYGFARRPGPGGGPLRGRDTETVGGRYAHLCRGIGVPQERMTRFSRVMWRSSEEMSGTRMRLETARGELMELLRAPEPDSAAVMAKVDEISALQGELEKKLVGRLLKASEVLQPEERGRLMRLIGRRCAQFPAIDRQGPGARGPAAGGVPRKEQEE